MAKASTHPAATTERNAPAAPTRTVAGPNGFKFKKVKSVTVPVLKLLSDQPVYIRVQSRMEVSKQIENKKAGVKPMDPATVLHVVDLSTGEEAILIVGKVLEGVFNETYADGSYVGKDFEIVNHGKRGDKKYNTYSVAQIEVEED